MLYCTHMGVGLPECVSETPHAELLHIKAQPDPNGTATTLNCGWCSDERSFTLRGLLLLSGKV